MNVTLKYWTTIYISQLPGCTFEMNLILTLTIANSKSMPKTKIMKNRYSSIPMFTVVLPDIIIRICELSHVWEKKICHSNLSEFFSQTPLPPSMSQSIIRLTPVPSGALKLSEKDFFFFANKQHYQHRSVATKKKLNRILIFKRV